MQTAYMLRSGPPAHLPPQVRLWAWAERRGSSVRETRSVREGGTHVQHLSGTYNAVEEACSCQRCRKKQAAQTVAVHTGMK